VAWLGYLLNEEPAHIFIASYLRNNLTLAVGAFGYANSSGRVV